jgi:hypothetical protein
MPAAGAMGRSRHAHREAMTEVCHTDLSVATQTIGPAIQFQALMLGCGYAHEPSQSRQEASCSAFEPRECSLLPGPWGSC